LSFLIFHFIASVYLRFFSVFSFFFPSLSVASFACCGSCWR
jgi:hypothetical protein